MISQDVGGKSAPSVWAGDFFRDLGSLLKTLRLHVNRLLIPQTCDTTSWFVIGKPTTIQPEYICIYIYIERDLCMERIVNVSRSAHISILIFCYVVESGTDPIFIAHTPSENNQKVCSTHVLQFHGCAWCIQFYRMHKLHDDSSASVSSFACFNKSPPEQPL